MIDTLVHLAPRSPRLKRLMHAPSRPSDAISYDGVRQAQNSSTWVSRIYRSGEKAPVHTQIRSVQMVTLAKRIQVTQKIRHRAKALPAMRHAVTAHGGVVFRHEILLRCHRPRQEHRTPCQFPQVLPPLLCLHVGRRMSRIPSAMHQFTPALWLLMPWPHTI